MSKMKFDNLSLLELFGFVKELRKQKAEAIRLLKERHGDDFEQQLSPKFIHYIEDNGPKIGVPIEDIEVKDWYHQTLAILSHYFGTNHKYTKKFSKLESDFTIDDTHYLGDQFGSFSSKNLLKGSFNILDNSIEQVDAKIEILKKNPAHIREHGQELLLNQVKIADNLLYPQEKYRILEYPEIRQWRESTMVFLKDVIDPSNTNFQKFQNLDGVFPGTRDLLKESRDLVMSMIEDMYSEKKEITIPVEITDSLSKFRKDYPNPQKVAFIVMQFGKTKAHDKIVTAIKSELHKHEIIGLKANDARYHDDLLYNVLTYIYGCGFGVAVFERIEDEIFNPNVSFEVGYLMAIGKPVCLLKDKTLKTLQTDLIGRLYEEFDPQKTKETINLVLKSWLEQKKII